MVSTQLKGSTGLWVWDIRNGSWYSPTTQLQGGVTMLPQVYFKATNLPSQGQIAALVSNTSGGLATGILQILDINSWSWSFPTTSMCNLIYLLYNVLILEFQIIKLLLEQLDIQCLPLIIQFILMVVYQLMQMDFQIQMLYKIHYHL